MNNKGVLSLVLLAHHPFTLSPSGKEDQSGRPGFFPGDIPFFEALSQTWLPLLELLTRLEQDRVPFRIGIAVSPVLVSMLQDGQLLGRYLDYVDKKLEFGWKELERNAQNPQVEALSRYYYEMDMERRIFFLEQCESDIPGFLRHFEKLGRVELLSTAATCAFLPFYGSFPEVIRSQLETALIAHRRAFGKNPQGFWPPEFGWSEGLDAELASFGFTYALADPRSLVLGDPPALKGSFYPVKTPSGFVLLGRDYQSKNDAVSYVNSEKASETYRQYCGDAGFELTLRALRPFLGKEGIRCSTGYRYHNMEGRGEKRLYDPEAASALAKEQARSFLDGRISLLEEASRYMDEAPLSLCAFDSGFFGQAWPEGMVFLETLIREAAASEKITLLSPGSYVAGQANFQTTLPGFSTWREDGYAETWLDASNDWIYRHIFRSVERMLEMTERFPNDTGLKERALNQAARELFLVLGSDWPKMLYEGIRPDFAREQIKEALRNFTTIFESLGSNYISTEWLTGLEKRHNIFPFLNYRVFGRKK